MPAQNTGVVDASSLPKGYLARQTTANVSITPVNTFVDITGCSLALPIGQYLVGACLSTVTVTGITLITAKLWDGTIIYSAAEASGAISGQFQIALPTTFIQLLAAATLKLSVAAATDAQTTVQYTIPTNGTGLDGKGTQIWAVRLA